MRKQDYQKKVKSIHTEFSLSQQYKNEFSSIECDKPRQNISDIKKYQFGIKK